MGEGFCQASGNLNCKQWPFSLPAVGHMQTVQLALHYCMFCTLISIGPCHGLGNYGPLTTESQVHSHTINMGFVVNKSGRGCL